MGIFDKQIDQIDEEDLRGLCENKVREKLRLDYKRELPARDDGARREFAYDISSFANAAGGIIFYGVTEEDGAAAEVVGLEVDGVDREISRLQHIALNGIDPRIAGLQVEPIQLQSGKYVIAVRIPRSWSVHMITLQGVQRFYARNSNGKHPMSVDEISEAFIGASLGWQRLNDFRLERVQRIKARDIALPLVDGATFVIHVVPMDALTRTLTFDVNPLLNNPMVLPMRGIERVKTRINFDGVIAAWDIAEGHVEYTQFYRNGSIEIVDAYSLLPRKDDRLILPGFEEVILGSMDAYLRILHELGVSPPIFVMMSLLEVRGYKMGGNERAFGREVDRIDRDDLLIPEQILGSFEIDLDVEMKPLFDAVWHAVGREGSPNYDNLGRHSEWKKPSEET